jgi:hypothetical protein
LGRLEADLWSGARTRRQQAEVPLVPEASIAPAVT